MGGCLMPGDVLSASLRSGAAAAPIVAALPEILVALPAIREAVASRWEVAA